MTQPLRIASVCTTLQIGGDENRLLSFAGAVDRRRFEHVVVLVLAPDPERDALCGAMLGRYREQGVEVVQLDEPSRSSRAGTGVGGFQGDVRAFGRVTWRLARLFRDRSIDVVDARMFQATLVATAAARLARVPVVVTTEYDVMYWYRTAWRFAIDAIYPFVDALVCDSAARLSEMQRTLRRPHRNAVVIPNGIPAPITCRSRKEMRRVLGLPENEDIRVVGQIGRLVPGKGHRVLLHAASRIIAEDSSVAFLVCGHPQVAAPGYRDALAAEARALGIADNVRFVAYPGPIADVWAAVDIHAHPTLHDSAPIAIHEGMALGRPAVVTRVAGIPEIVEDERTGLVVPPDDADAVACALLRLLRDPALAQRLGDAARARHEERYRPEVMADALGRLFEQLAEEKRDQRGAVLRPVGAPRTAG